MLERLHDHIVEELGHSSRTDTIFIIVAVVFNLIVLGINSGAAAGASSAQRNSGNSFAADLVLGIFVIMTLLVNAVAIAGLAVGRRTRTRLFDGLIAMYADNHVDQYYDRSLVSNYGTRYKLFAVVIILLGFTAIVVPLVIRLA